MNFEMRIVCLMENTTEKKDYKCEHGLCFYVETAEHRLLADTGANAWSRP